ncbi:MAG TPA: hypothetical protein VHF90_03770 [Thermoleophilaceae bacterium]|nr:hypothetical protein [Thermoleophilaceae bacterium]
MATAPLVAASCGDRENHLSVTATLTKAVERFEARDTEGLCELLSANAKVVIGSAVHLQPTTCEPDVRRFFKWLKPHDRPGARPVVTSIGRDGPGRVTAKVRTPGGTPVTIGLRKEDGAWKVEGLLDATLSRIQARNTPRENELLVPVSRAAAGARNLPSSVAVADDHGRPCPDVDGERLPTVAGGCLFELAGERLELSAVSPFGTMAFAECDVALDVQMDGRGQGWISDMSIDGRNPCFDAAPCFSGRQRGLPWRSWIVRRGGGLELRIDVCLDTCVGRFEGRWDLALVRHGDGWRARADQAMVGTSGWRFDGVLDGPARLTVTPRGGP